MKLTSESFTDQGNIPERNAFGKIDGQNHVALAGNANPHLAWTDAPGATQSFVVICHDPDVPSKPDDVNQEGREIPSDLPRVDFYHWALIDIPATTTEIGEGAYSDGITPRGKAGPLALDGTRQGVNDFTTWFAADRDMNGDYYGYDGPCPPWNDERLHHYHFRVAALGVASLGLDGRFDINAVRKAMQGHVLAEAELIGTYTLSASLRR